MSFDPRYLCNLIHETQKERGLAALYLSMSNNDSNELKEQFNIVDSLTKNIHFLEKYHSYKALPLLDSIGLLPSKRSLILNKGINAFEMSLFYSQVLISKAIELIEEVMILHQKNDPTRVSAFINFLKWKERVGFERAIGINFIKDRKWSEDLKDRLRYIISEQQAYERMFLSLADMQVKESIDIASKKSEAFTRIEEINESILNGTSSKEVEFITTSEWFRIFTIKMELLHKISETMIANLPTLEEVGVREEVYCNYSGNLLKKSVLLFLNKIRRTKLFSGVDDQLLNNILLYARVIGYKKREKIFLQNDSASRFYLVLDGFVKITKHGSGDDESIMQIIGNDEEILETSALSNNNRFTVSAEAVENAKILLIPASIIRDGVKNNKYLASNALNLVANHSQSIIGQFGQVFSKDIKKRVGWFLLKLSLENLGKSKRFDLPYSKALIAHYLGMRPETFSRALHGLKESGINIEKDVVLLSDLYSLCNFCDSDTYSRCSIAGQNQCLSKSTWEV